jgi:hypothetical protein
MREGFFLGVDYPKNSGNWYEPRLTRGEYAKRRAYDDTAYDGTSGIHIDDTGLWEFLDPTIRYPDVPATCDARTFEADFDPNDHPDITGYSSLDWFYSDFMAKRNSPNPANERFVPGPRSRLHMETCLRDYQARRDGGDTSMPALFTDELAQSPRLGWLPILEGSPPSGVSAPRKVLGFRAIYVNTLFASCNGTHGCDQVWEPGEEHGGMSNSAVRQKRRNVSIPSVSRLDAMSSYAMDDYMLPPAVQQTNPTYGGGFDGIQLSR